MTKVKDAVCYIDEVDGVSLEDSVREKRTGRRVRMGGATEAELRHFRVFLEQADGMRDAAPGNFDSDNVYDAIHLSGNVLSETPDEVVFGYDADLQYLYV